MRLKKVCLLWEKCLFGEKVLILGSGGFRILGIVLGRLNRIDPGIRIGLLEMCLLWVCICLLIMSGDSNGLHPFWFLGDLTLGDGLTLIGSYIQSDKNQSESLTIDFWTLGD